MATGVNDTSLIVQNTPQCLRERRQWVCWRYERGKNGEIRKVPRDAKTGRTASVSNPMTWTSFEKAVEAFASRQSYNGVGFVFTKDDPFCGIDLDDCINGAGELAEWARQVVEGFNTYTEISPSESGVKLFLKGRKPDFAQCSFKDVPGGAGEIELYDNGRYFALTGMAWDGCPLEVHDRQQELDELCATLWPQKADGAAEAPPSGAPASTQPAPPAAHNDDRVPRCLAAMLEMKVADKNDGSHRLFAACCRCVEHDLTDGEAIVAVRSYQALRPFPRR